MGRKMSGFCMGGKWFETAEDWERDDVEGEPQHKRYLKEFLDKKDWEI